MKKLFFLALVCCCTQIVDAQSVQNALRMDGTNDHVQTSFPAILGNNPRSIEAWIKTTANSNPNTSGVQHIITDMGGFVSGGRFTFNVLWSNAIRLEVGGSGLSGQTPINDGLWHHVACVYDPLATNTISLYVDGVLDTAGNIATPVNTITGPLTIGKRVDNARYWQGDIDEVRVWNVAKSAVEINILKNEELCANQSGLVAYYRCNQGTANGINTTITTLQDNSAGANDGVLTNFGLSGSSSNWVNGATITAAPHSDSTFTIESCGSYSTPGGSFISTSGTYTETISNALGCDSVLTLNITINTLSFTRDTVHACDSFRSVQGILYNNSQVFNEIFTNVIGCDSIVQTNLIVGSSTRDTLNVKSCYTYTSPSGRSWNTSGTYTDSLFSALGCDSIVVLNLTIADSSTTSLFDTACKQYISPKGNILTTSGTYRETFINAEGCDSIVTINLVINKSSDSMITELACDSFTSESGQNTWFNSGRYAEIFVDKNECDSTVTYVLDINYTSTGTLVVETCEPFSLPGGTQILTSGIYTDVLTNSAGCDSILTVNATVTDNKLTVTKNGDNLEVDIEGLAYQWLNCNTNNEKVPGATNASFRPTFSGDYAVEVTENNCADTSDCINYSRTASTGIVEKEDAMIFPNPADGQIKVLSNDQYKQVTIINRLGQAVLTLENYDSQSVIDISTLEEGIYFLKMQGAKNEKNIAFVIKR